MEDYIFTSNLDYTIFRPPGLTDESATNQTVIEPNRTQNSHGKWTITRADLAAIMIDAVEKNQ